MPTREWLKRGDEYPPPGRQSMSLFDAKGILVDAKEFAKSTTRADIWSNFELYLARFVELEERHAKVMESISIVSRVWIGGSFVSSKVDPRNIDVSVFVNGDARAILKGKPGAGWLRAAFDRNRVLSEYSVSPLEIPYVAIGSPFRSSEIESEHQDYLRERGAWDDWWQRARDKNRLNDAPDIGTSASVRGYIEVVL